MRRVSSAAALVTAAAAVAFTAACGGSGDSTGTGQTPGNGGGNNAFAAYIQCLQQNGVTITMPSFGGNRNRPSDGASRGPRPSGEPRPSGSGFPRGGGGFGGLNQKPDNVDQATWDKAQSACSSLRPSIGAGGNGRGRGRDNGANAAYRNCLRDHGVTGGGQQNSDDETVKKAMEACKVLQPQASATPSA